MCGIAGMLATGEPRAVIRGQLERMILTLEHRGPDGFGFHAEDGVGLAHARLSIIDLETGQQPIHNETADCHVVLNGEIFNYLELRSALEARGHRFYTKSDTEVLVHLYEERGEDFVLELNGQFALALWDARRGRLLLARDRAGIRPLFVRAEGNRVWFASEIKALLAARPDSARLSLTGIAQTFCFWAPFAGQTAFDGVESLPAGEMLLIDATGSRRRRYWDWDQAGNAGAMDEPTIGAARLRELMDRAVRLQLRADVPVGAYISGGLDSAVVASLAQRACGGELRTFAMTFEDPQFDESAYQRSVVQSLGTRHTAVECRRSDIGRVFPRLVRHTEAPVLRTAAAPLLLLSAAVHAAGLKVVLSGEGADEVFGGYDLFKEAKIRRFWARQPQSRWRPLLLRRLYGYLRDSPVRQGGVSTAFFAKGLDHPERSTFAHEPRWLTSSRALRFLSREARASLGDWKPVEWLADRLPPTLAARSPLARDQYVEARTLLEGYLLSSQGDRVGMANAVETRYPFLDPDVIDFGLELPDRLKLRGLTEKYLLRRAFAGVLPAEVLNRTKQPYRAPESESFFENGEPLDYVADLLSGERLRRAGWFDPGAVGALLDKCRAREVRGFSDNQAFVGILSTMLLEHEFVGSHATSASAPVLATERVGCDS